MPEMVIRPTMKFVYMGYAVVLLIVAAAVAAEYQFQLPDSLPLQVRHWIPWLPALLLLWPMKHHLRNRLTKMTILDDKLRYETGLFTTTARNILISRVQDITVHQRLGQRIFGVGDLSFETAGETSRLTIRNIERPQAIADHINHRSQKDTSTGQLT